MTDLPPDLYAAVCDRMPIARLAVIDDTGVPDVMPIVFARIGTALYSPIDGKPKKSPRLSRLAHVAARPAVGLVIDHYAPDWSSLWWVRIAARARIAHDDDAAWAQAVGALRAKYPQYATTALFEGPPTMLVFEPRTVRWWAAGGAASLRAWSAPA